jgi:hypothetical protein
MGWEVAPMTLRQQLLWNVFGIWTALGPKPHRCPGCKTTWLIDKNKRALCDDCTGGS